MDEVVYVEPPDPQACPLCGKTTCPYAQGGDCEGWEVRLPEEDVFLTRDRIRAFGWQGLVLVLALVGLTLYIASGPR